LCAYALVGDIERRSGKCAFGFRNQDGNDVYSEDIWPTFQGSRLIWSSRTVTAQRSRKMPTSLKAMKSGSLRRKPPDAKTYGLPPQSTMFRNPPYFQGMSPEAG